MNANFDTKKHVHVKRLHILIIFSISGVLTALTQSSCKSERDSVVMAEHQTKAQDNNVNKNDAKFLIEMADARMMDSKEGQLAMERGTRADIRSYGQLMVTDQAQLLEEIQALARQENIVLPARISQTKADGLAALEKLSGNEFDHKFISMITIDHERDIKQFKMASEDSGDFSPPIRNFAKRRLALIESHLEKVKVLSTSRNRVHSNNLLAVHR